MKKAILAIVAVVAVLAIVLISTGEDSDDAYLVRAIFDNSSFLVSGEEVRVAGATVGEIESVDVTRPGEISSYEDGRPQAIPGKAVLVMKIEDPGFQDFRRDASCIIRPQSLIGEKFIDCRPTLPRAPGSPPPPPLREIPDDQPGAGQLLLPLEQNSSTVDPDLINNINRLPYVQRFRLILNELGVGLAGRGEDVEEAVKRANPVLRDTTRLLGILSQQREQLAQLNVDSEQILAAMSRERASVAGFFSNAGAAAEASAEEGEALEANFRKLPEFLRQLRQTVRGLQGFSDAAAPVFADLDRATPAFTEATRALTPFSAATTVSLRSLGAAGEEAGPKLRAADPVVLKLRDLARSGAVPTSELARFLVSTEKEGGWEGLVDLIYNTTAAANEFDRYGHFLRARVTLSNCITYEVAQTSSCVSAFNGPKASISSVFDPASLYRQFQEEIAEKEGEATASGALAAPDRLGPDPGSEPAPGPSLVPELGKGEELGAEALGSRSQRALLDYLLAP
ncbi:MAG TPA: MlaD family protein [Solirubrobacterales bacterium]|nr:MlaD family protein [Solirubrobacterales bacterium]